MASQDRVPVLLAPPLLTPPLLAPPVVATPPTPLEEAPPPLVVPPVPFPPVPEPPAFAPPMLAPPLVAAPPLLALPPTLLVLLPPLPPPVEPPMLALPPALSALLLPPVPPAELDAVPPALAPPMLRLPALPLDPPFAALVPPLPVAPPEGEVVDDCGLAHPTPIMAAENMITPNFQPDTRSWRLHCRPPNRTGPSGTKPQLQPVTTGTVSSGNPKIPATCDQRQVHLRRGGLAPPPAPHAARPSAVTRSHVRRTLWRAGFHPARWFRSRFLATQLVHQSAVTENDDFAALEHDRQSLHHFRLRRGSEPAAPPSPTNTPVGVQQIANLCRARLDAKRGPAKTAALSGPFLPPSSSAAQSRMHLRRKQRLDSLQWGRRLVATESSSGGQQSVTLLMLQWGRRLVATERPCVWWPA